MAPKLFNLIQKKLTKIALLCALLLIWIIFQLLLPFGNHLSGLIGINKEYREQLDHATSLFSTRLFSEIRVFAVGYSCDSSLLMFNDRHRGYISIPNDAIARSIELYEVTKSSLSPSDDVRIRSHIRGIINSCDPNLGLAGRPPIIQAIFAEETEFVELLLVRGANPFLTYISGSGSTVSPYRVAERLAEIEAEHLKEDPNHPKATGKAKIIIEIIKGHIKKADLDAQFQLGYRRKQAGNYEEAFQNFLAAAEQGHSSSQNLLASFYWQGIFVEQNYDEAARWYLASALQGNACSKYNLGRFYFSGKGVSKDYAEAYRWFRASADQGFASAQNHLGALYFEGKGVPQNHTEAFRWFFTAAKQGNISAKSNLGLTYHKDGIGFYHNPIKAFFWSSIAAFQSRIQRIRSPNKN